MNVKKCKLLILFLLIVLSVGAQEKKVGQTWKKKTTVKEYKSAMKDKKYGDAQNIIDKATAKFEQAKADAQLQCLKTESQMYLISAENKKIYLNQKPDTAKYFNLILELYQTGLLCDSLEQADIAQKTAAGKKGKTVYRPVVASRMMTYRDKVAIGGKFFYKKKDYAKAYKFFNIYLSTKNADDFWGKSAASAIATEDDSNELSALATLSAFGSNNHKGVMSYLSESLKNKSLESKLLEIGSKSAAVMGDTLEMVNLLENGFYKYPDVDYFFLSLIKYYNDMGQCDKALSKAVHMTKLHGDNRDYMYVKGKEEMLVQQWDSAVVSFGKCVLLKPDDAESFSSLGNVYLHKAHELYSKLDDKSYNAEYTKQKKQLNELYIRAMENFESARKFKEDDESLWLEGLREVYFKLNKGKELKSLDAASGKK